MNNTSQSMSKGPRFYLLPKIVPTFVSNTSNTPTLNKSTNEQPTTTPTTTPTTSNNEAQVDEQLWYYYLINGCKWFITGAEGADFVIIMARGEDGSATMFLSDMTAPGLELVRKMDALDSCFTGGHGVLQFTNLRVPAKQILGELGKGFKYAQVRLAPARLTHCMRWLGQARRAQDIAIAYAQRRQAFGKTLGEHEGIGFMLADNDMDLQTARLHIWHTAWLLDQGERVNFESSRAKVICSEAEWRVVDRCVQILGGQGVTGETELMKIFQDMRGFRIYDGPSEVHRWSMARKILSVKENK
jgi:acyl-CoA dehydrogenase